MARKLSPALYRLVADGHIPFPPFVIGVGRRDISEGEFRAMIEAEARAAVGASFDPRVWESIARHVSYEQGFFEDTALYQRLVGKLTRFDKDANACVPRFFYLATPPQHYETILTNLESSKLSVGCGQDTPEYTRILIEKPFGKDLATSQELEHVLSRVFVEKQIYRIDHYLDKETVQNVLAVRFANGIFEPTWNNQFLDHVQIALLEPDGVGKRGAFYDGVGATRDVVQNHMLQMLAFTAMDQPKAFDSDNLRRARQHVIQAIRPLGAGQMSQAVRGQYIGYTKEANVDPLSETETFVALKLTLDIPRWKGVPFYLRTGKKLKSKVTEISLHFKKPVVCTGPLCLFPEPQVKRNVLVLRISPDRGMSLRLMAKKRGLGMDLTSIEMQQVGHGGLPSHGEYERLLLDAIRGDQTLFAESREVEASWRFVSGILDAWKEKKSSLYQYKPGSWGPAESEEFIKKDQRSWYLAED
ncbi:glucose-6-phosphate dehydrogenase [Candidatus Gottesmanbacteria bacterium]|nr:glucose-6-phosphate dehydrogenase [Candidatus Gottesmanbacteria bacterium]